MHTKANTFSPIRLHTQSATLSKKSSNLDFSSQLQRVAVHGTNFAAQSLGHVAPYVPGGAVLSAALQDASATLEAGPNSNGALQGSSNQAPFLQSMASLQQNMMSSNVYMIGLQQEFQQMSQKYMTISNILKMKHDTEKSSIQNMR